MKFTNICCSQFNFVSKALCEYKDWQDKYGEELKTLCIVQTRCGSLSYTADLLSSITNDQEMGHYMRNLTVEYL